MVGHMSLYKNVLHHSNNTLPKWYLEILGVYVSLLNDCEYCVEHHYAGLTRLLKDDKKAIEIRNSLQNRMFLNILNDKFVKGLHYAEKLTLDAKTMKQEDVAELRQSGLTDGEILEINQVVSYFNYANRTVLGLGVSTKGDILGLSPNDSSDETNWNHQ